MNKGLYFKTNGTIIYLKYWKNSRENSGVTISLEKSDYTHKFYPWSNVADTHFKNHLGAECLARW